MVLHCKQLRLHVEEALARVIVEIHVSDLDIRRQGVGVNGVPVVLRRHGHLAGSEIHLLTKTGREFVLGRALKPLIDGYDYTFIDCAPSLGILTLNALTAASHVLIPFQAETLSHRAVGQLLETIEDVRAYTNENLGILGAVATMFDARTNLGRRTLVEVSEMHNIEVLPPPIPRSVKVAEAPERGRSVLAHAHRSKSAEAYRQLAEEIERRI